MSRVNISGGVVGDPETEEIRAEEALVFEAARHFVGPEGNPGLDNPYRQRRARG
jgi:hypothetical protein